MYNQAVPVKVGNGVHAVILFGEMQVADGEHQQRSLENHQQAVAQLELTQDQASNLRNRMLSSKPYTLEQLENFRFKLQPITQFLYKVFEEDERLKRNVEKVTHELQTRLQSVIAVSENLVSKVGNLETADLREKTNEVLNTALAMATVVNNWGAFAGSYHFRKQLLAPILYEAKRLYRAEAERRGIQIHISFEQESNGPTIEFSRDHMQLALNNFMHNAVKYSFRSQPGGKRFVKIIGIPAGRCYMITIENYGVGILPEEKDLIFQDKYQGKLTEREYRTGSGKGLYFAKQVIDRHHGRIKVDSRMMSEETHQDGRPHLNQFTIYVPYEQPQEDSPDAKNNCMD
jgi:signal transduction histidine kinase